MDRKQGYQLVCELNDQLKIKRVYRYLPFLEGKDYSISDRIIIKWVGKFFYHLDIGDEEAMYDLVFHNDTKLVYNKLTDKRQIIRRLLEDFPKIIKPREIEIKSNKSKYRVGIYASLGSNLLLEINSKLANITDTDELQENLYINLERAIYKTKSASIGTKYLENIYSIAAAYPDAVLKGDTLQIKYPCLGLNSLKRIYYLLDKN